MSKEGADGGQWNLELADRHVAFRKQRHGHISRAHQSIRAGNDNNGVVGVGDGDDSRSGLRLRRILHERQIDTLCRQKCSQIAAERILADAPNQRRRGTQLRGDRLVGALAAGEIQHFASGDDLAELRLPLGRRHHIHIDAAGNEYAAHVVFPVWIPGSMRSLSSGRASRGPVGIAPE
jgi:hypothetical protein